MEVKSVHVWGDSILKGIAFDEARRRYTIIADNCLKRLSDLMKIEIRNHARMGQTAPKAEADMREGDLVPGGLALLGFGGNDCDLNWAEVAAEPETYHAPQTDIEAFANSLARMARRVTEAGMQPMLVVPTPLDAARYFGWVTKTLDKEAVLRHIRDVHHIYRWQELYANVVVDTAASLSCPILNLRSAFLSKMHLSGLLCADGIHPNAAGHQVMLEAIVRRFAMAA